MADPWVQGYLQASFRGVEFFISGHNRGGGRRLATHIFPEVEKVKYEDLGNKEDTVNLTAYIVDKNYYAQRNDLVNALREPGPGKLVHPYLGEITVRVDSWTLTETTGEGRVARFGLNFKDDSQEPLTLVVPNTQSQVYQRKTSLLESIGAWLDNVYDLAQQPVRAIEDVNATLQQGLDLVDKVKAIANTQADFKRVLSNTRGKIIELSISAQAIAQDFQALIGFGTDQPRGTTLSATSENSREQLNELKQMTDFADEPVTDTPEEVALDPDYPAQQIQKTIVFEAVANMCGLMTFVPFESAEDAEQEEAALFDIINGLMLDESIDDDIYENLRDIKAAVHNDIEARSITLPRIVEYELPQETNTLQLSYDLYGEIESEQEIIDRNQIDHPGFVSTANKLKIKVNG